jgi:hypothetical protein
MASGVVSADYCKERARELMERVARAEPTTAARLRVRAQEFLDLALALQEKRV